MGCFNVACSVSNLSINAGDRVVYIPLLPKNWNIRHYPDYKHHLVGTHSGLIYSNCYFNPLTFPIRGHYNDYGSIEDVDVDANTKAIKKFFGMEVEDFVKSAERNWCREYVSDQKEIGKYFIKEFKELNNVREDDLSENFMLKMGFLKDDQGMYTFKEYPYKISLRDSGSKDKDGRVEEGYHILDKETGKEVKTREHNGFYKNYLLADMAELTGYYIGVKESFQNKINIMENLSGMFIHEDIYNLLCKPANRADFVPEETMLLELGFILDKDKKSDRDRDERFYYHPEVEDDEAYIRVGDYGSPSMFNKDTRDKYYGDWLKSSYELAETYIEKHGVVLDLTPYTKEAGAMPSFRKIQSSIKDYTAFKKEEEKAKKSEGLLDLYKKFPDMFRHPLSKTNLNNDGLRCFEDWDYLNEIYGESFEKGTIAKEYCEWLSAKSMMYSANVFFFPAMNGEQHGNDSVSKKVLKGALAVIEAREKVYRDENLCPKCYEDDCDYDCE